jgi:phage tail sheath protein FI
MEELDNITFELNTVETRGRMEGVVNSFLSDIQARGGLYDFRVVCDETNNTPQVIAEHKLYLDVYVEPVQGIEYPIGRVAITQRGSAMEAVIV